jgi:hypothetical protein
MTDPTAADPAAPATTTHRTRIAFHEAGHAVAMAALGQTTDFTVTIVAGEGYGGKVHWDEQKLTGADLATAAYASEPAVRLIPGEEGYTLYDRDEQVAAEHLPDPAHRKIAKKRAAALVARHAASVREVARQLLERETLTAAEVAAVVAANPPPLDFCVTPKQESGYVSINVSLEDVGDRNRLDKLETAEHWKCRKALEEAREEFMAGETMPAVRELEARVAAARANLAAANAAVVRAEAEWADTIRKGREQLTAQANRKLAKTAAEDAREEVAVLEAALAEAKDAARAALKRHVADRMVAFTEETEALYAAAAADMRAALVGPVLAWLLARSRARGKAVAASAIPNLITID